MFFLFSLVPEKQIKTCEIKEFLSSQIDHYQLLNKEKRFEIAFAMSRADEQNG